MTILDSALVDVLSLFQGATMLDNQVPNRKLKHERERRGLSQQRLAELLGTSFENISRWERGVTSPQPHFREKLCKLFKKDAAELGLIVQEVSSEVISLLPESVPGPETLETSHTTSSLHARSDHPTLSRPPTIMDNALTSQERKRAKREDWAEAPHVRQMYGRREELQELQRWILDDHVRLTALFGMGGIGKTTLAVAVADLVKSSFDLVFWRSLHNAPPLERLLQDCITFVSDRQRTDLPEDQDEQITLLMSYLREHRCLLIVDNFETTLQSGKGTGAYREGYEGYGKLLQRIGESKHVSCLLLTSREKPHEVALFEGGSSPVRSRRLEGLGPSYGREILREEGLHGEDDAWEDLVTHYGGNPLSLKLVAQFILELFLKTRKDLYEELESVIRTHHSYELPGILAIPVVAGSQTYVEWLQENLKEKRKTVKEQLLQTLNEAHKQLIAAAVDAHKRVNVREGEWGPREVLAHIMGWEAEAAARIPLLVAGHLPVKYSDETFNAAIITAIGNQPFDEICNLLRQAHQRLIGVLTTLDDDIFVPGNPVHTRVEAIIHHNLEHAHALGYMK